MLERRNIFNHQGRLTFGAELDKLTLDLAESREVDNKFTGGMPFCLFAVATTLSTEAIQGAKDIIAEDISDNAEFRKELRRLTFEFGTLSAKAAKEEDSVYSQYYEYCEALKKVLPHRVLAINRGEKEEFLKASIAIAPEIVLNYLFSQILLNNQSPAENYVSAAILDSYDRLIAPSIEREIRSQKGTYIP